MNKFDSDLFNYCVNSLDSIKYTLVGIQSSFVVSQILRHTSDESEKVKSVLERLSSLDTRLRNVICDMRSLSSDVESLCLKK